MPFASAGRGSSISSLTGPTIAPSSWTRPHSWSSSSKLSGVSRGNKDSRYCRDAGWSSEPLDGSFAGGASCAIRAAHRCLRGDDPCRQWGKPAPPPSQPHWTPFSNGLLERYDGEDSRTPFFERPSPNQSTKKRFHHFSRRFKAVEIKMLRDARIRAMRRSLQIEVDDETTPH